MTQNKTTPLYEVGFLLLLALAFAFGSKRTMETVHFTASTPVQDVAPSITLNPPATTLPVAKATVVHGETLYHLEQRMPAPHYSTLPMPANEGDWGSYKLLIVMAARYTGVNPDELAMTAARESNFFTAASNQHSTATGLFQFINSTWYVMVDRYGAKYGITHDTPKTDPRANALMGAEYAKENEAYLAKLLGRPVQPTEIYMAHLLGAGGALSMIKARSTALAINVRPDSVPGNARLFYNKVNGVSKPVTVYEFRQKLRKHTAELRKLYGESAIAYSGLLSGHREGKPMALNYLARTAKAA